MVEIAAYNPLRGERLLVSFQFERIDLLALLEVVEGDVGQLLANKEEVVAVDGRALVTAYVGGIDVKASQPDIGTCGSGD